MLQLEQNDSVKQYFSELNILTVYGLYIFECIMHIKQQGYVQPYENQHSYNTRFKNNITLPRHNLEFYRKKTSYSGFYFLKKLPKSIADMEDGSRFRRALKEYITTKSLYSLKEFYS